MDWINIALPKGRLGEKAYAMLKNSGYPCPAIEDPGRKLIFENPEKMVRYFWVKPSDVAIYVERGAADLGIVGDIAADFTRQRGAFEGIIDPFVLRAQGARNGVVCIQHQGYRGSDGGGELFNNDVDIAVAGELVAEEVGHQHHVRRKVVKNQHRIPLVHFQDNILSRNLPPLGCTQQGGSYPAGEIGAFGVVNHPFALRGQDRGNHIGRGGFAVGAGHSNNFSLEFKT